MGSILTYIDKLENWLDKHVYNFTMAFITGFWAYMHDVSLNIDRLKLYFGEIEGLVYLTIAVIIADFATGIIASRKKGKGIKSKYMWRTVYKSCFAIFLLHISYSFQVEVKVDLGFYKLVAGAIIGFESWSILENWAKWSDSKLAVFLQKIIQGQIKKHINVDIQENKEDENNKTNKD